MLKTKQDAEAWFASWIDSNEALLSAFENAFTADGEWVAGPPPIPPTRGGKGAADLLRGFKQSHDLTTIRVELLRCDHTGDHLYTERIDHLIDSNGKTFISIPLAGIFDIDADGLITYWRDHWDMHEFNAL